MSTRDRRVAIPVPAEHKPSLWKTFRHKIRLPRSPFARAEERNPRAAESEYNSGQRDVSLNPLYNQASQRQSIQKKQKWRRESPQRRRTHTDRESRKQSIFRNGRAAPAAAIAAQELSRVMSDPEMSRRAVATQYNGQQQSPYYDAQLYPQELARTYESSYVAPSRVDQRFQQPSWDQQWDSRQYGYGLAQQPLPYYEYEDARRYYRPAGHEYYQNPYLQQGTDGPYHEYPDDQQRKSKNKKKKDKKKSRKDKKARFRRQPAKLQDKLCDDPCMAPRVSCVPPEEVFGADSDSSDSRDDRSDLSDSWAESEQVRRRQPTPGILEATILQNYTDNTLDASAIEAEAHNAVLQLSDKVRGELQHSAEEVGAAFTKATDEFLFGPKKSRRLRPRSQGQGTDMFSQQYEKYFDKFAVYDSAYDDVVTDVEGVTDAEGEDEEESMASEAHDFSSSEEIEMTWPRWRQVSYGALPFGKQKS